jgi:beta-galactosidase
MDADWAFLPRDAVGAERGDWDDSAWQHIRLPHTWNNLDGQDGGNNYYRGVAWYRRHLVPDASWAHRSVYLKFDAASITARVYVNGTLIGTHAGAFSAFCLDVTPFLRLDGDNVVAVRVSNAKDMAVPPLSGDFTMFGGLYRDVHLLVVDPLHVSTTDDASSGVYVRQEQVDAAHASLSVATVLDNLSDARRAPKVRCQVVDAAGVVVATGVRTSPSLAPGARGTVSIPIVVHHPHRWRGRRDPYLYSVRVAVLDGAKTRDEVVQSVGLRSFRVDPNLGFLLNGEPYRLLGVNRHQDHLDEGWAIQRRDHQADFNTMLDMGCTAVRLSHYQHAQEFYTLCDRGGLVAWAEIPVISEVRDTLDFDTNASQQLRELIKQSYNHPSICFWGLSNELSGDPKAQRHQVDLMTLLNALAKSLDPGRLTTQASMLGPGQPQDAVTDVLGFNRYYGWYGGGPEQMASGLDAMHAAYPHRGVCLSEYGAGASVVQHESKVRQPQPGGPWHPEEWQGVVHEQAWAAIKSRPWLWGAFVWCEHDFAVDQRNEGDHPGRNDKGLVTYDGQTRKDAFYFYQANWSSHPVVHITESRFTPRSQADMPVKVYSNCEHVELRINGKSLGSVPKSDVDVLVWNRVHLIPGRNHLEAVGTRPDGTYSDSCTIDLQP